MRYVSTKFLALICTLQLVACRSSYDDSEEDAGSAGGFAGSRTDVAGSIASQTGSQSQMQGWIVALMERDSGIGRVSEADVNGNLKFSKASLSAPQTVVLLSPDYLIQSVLALPSTTPKTVRQYFQMTRNALPRLVQKGGVVNFQSTDSISIQPELAKDENADAIPDGVAAFGLLADDPDFAFITSDTDKDGIDNAVDSDIDGDGVLDAFDSDDDGDGVADVVDTDADGDGLADALEQTSDQHFSAGFEYIAVQNVATSTSNSLKFVAKVKEGVIAKAVKIRGASSFVTGATFTSSDNTTAAWDLSLADDGKNEDGAEKDLLYVRNVTLASGVAPRTNQVVFFQLVMGDGTEEFTAEFPYMFPSLAGTVPTTSFEPSTRVVTLAGEPFGASMQNFVWTVSVKNSSGIKVYESNPIAGATRTLVLPANILVSGQTYTYQATAQLMEKVPGYPSMLIQTDAGTISN